MQTSEIVTGSEISNVDVASAKVVLDNPGVRIYDFFSLLKINGEWKIVNKSYTFERKQAKK